MEPTYRGPAIQPASLKRTPGFWTTLSRWIWTGTVFLQLPKSSRHNPPQFLPNRFLSTLLRPFGLAAYQVRFDATSRTLLLPRFAVQPLTTLLSTSPNRSFQIHGGDWVWLDRLTYRFRSPHRFEVVAIQNNGPYASRIPGTLFLKRIVALPNERIRIRDDGRLEINGHLIPSPPSLQSKPNFHGYLNQEQARKRGLHLFLPLTPNAAVEHFVHPHSYFVLGDASAISLDSRVFGDVRAERILGRVLCRLWPFRRPFQNNPSMTQSFFEKKKNLNANQQNRP